MRVSGIKVLEISFQSVRNFAFCFWNLKLSRLVTLLQNARGTLTQQNGSLFLRLETQAIAYNYLVEYGGWTGTLQIDVAQNCYIAASKKLKCTAPTRCVGQHKFFG